MNNIWINENKIQFLDRKVEENEWTEGRWARPIKSTYEKIIDADNFDYIAFPITPYKKPKRKFDPIHCKFCKREFIPSNSKNIMCGFCFDIKICRGCKKIFIIQHDYGNKYDSFCSKDCSRNYACEKMNEYYEENPEKRSENMKKNHEMNDEYKYCKKCKEITLHMIGVGCLSCHNKTESKRESSKINMIKLWEDEEFKDSAWQYKYCEKCEEKTLHKFGFCLKCYPEKHNIFHDKFCEKCEKETKHYGIYCIECNPEKIEHLYIGHIQIFNEFCSTCNQETPHKIDKDTSELYCQVCAGEKIWCEKHEVFETIEYHSDPLHGLFYKAKTTKWIKEHYDEFEYITSIINYKNNIQNSKVKCGIYLWRIDNIPYYSGKSNDILLRSYDHAYEIQNNSEYWLNIKDEILNGHTLTLEILEECDTSNLHEKELYWINKLLPMSQKCDGTDHIIPYNQRKFNMDNLSEKYEERRL